MRPSGNGPIESQRLGEVLDRYPELGDSLLRTGARDEVWIDAQQRRVLFDAGDRDPRFPLVVEGRIRVTFPTLDGTELFLYVLGPGDLCAMTALTLLSGDPGRARAIAETRVSGIGLSGDSFKRLLRSCDPFRQKVFASLARNVDALLTLLEEVTRLNVTTRLSRRLLARAPVVTTTHQELADVLGCSRERISRVLENFQRSGWVQLGRGVIRVVDAGALRRAASQQGQPYPGPV